MGLNASAVINLISKLRVLMNFPTEIEAVFVNCAMAHVSFLVQLGTEVVNRLKNKIKIYSVPPAG